MTISNLSIKANLLHTLAGPLAHGLGGAFAWEGPSQLTGRGGLRPGHRRSGGKPNVLLGREAELLRFEAGVQHAQSGSGAFVAVAGTAGIGKSRLLAEL